MQEVLEQDVVKRYEKRKQVYRRFGLGIEKIHKLILESAGPLSGKVLEVGTGKGYMTLTLAQMLKGMTSIDISREELEYARLLLSSFGLSDNVHLQIADSHKLPFPDASFNTIFSLNTIHHLDNPFASVNECIRVLAPGGTIVLCDFSEQGFFIVGKIHQSEGNHHNCGEISLEEVKDYVVSKKIRFEWKNIGTHNILKIYG
ncbi:MAG: class I SAM-dependent methyltransferase [Candidatus Theseobacter exili]|nr:class I SAM-dependent methyltransferase [Candidatus Theseobacter exili]